MGGKLHTFAVVAFKQKTELAACQRLILPQTAGKHRFQIGRIVAQVRSGGCAVASIGFCRAVIEDDDLEQPVRIKG